MTTGQFFKINNINLSYSLPSRITSKLYMSGLRVYVASSNPLLVTDFLYFNPEVSNSNNPLTPGVFNYNYPIPKSLTFGINATF